MPKRSLWNRLKRHFGRRGGILTLLGAMFIFLGYSYATHDANRFSRPGTGGPLEFMDSAPFPGVFWMLCGLIALTNGFFRRRLNNEDAVGFASLIMAPLLWMSAYIISFTQWLVTEPMLDEPYGQQDAYIGATVFLIIVVIVRIVANWTDESDVEHAVGKKISSGELALLDRVNETKEENDARGVRAREESELWIKHARIETEQRIADSAAENDRMLKSIEHEHEISRANTENRERE